MAAGLLSLTFTAALPAADDKLPGVTVYGTATVKVTPDLMVWNLTVYNRGLKLPAVAEQHATLVQQTLSFLKQRGIKDSELQTSQMEFGENWEYRNQSRVKEGYVAATRIPFRSADLAAYKPLWLGLAEISGVTVEGVSYDHSKRIDYQNETRRNAVLAAKEKAAALAKALGAEIAEPLRIEEDLSVNEAWRAQDNRISAGNYIEERGTGGADQESLAPGTIPIRTRVQVTFRLVSRGG